MDNVKENSMENQDCIENDAVLFDFSKIGFNKSHATSYEMMAELEMNLKNKIKQS